MPDIVTVGEILVEIMAEKIGQSFLSPGKLDGPFPSGAPAIMIDQAARMGASAGIISKVGRDDFGRLNLARLSRDGVDVSQVLEDDIRTTGIAFVAYDPDGGRRFLYHFSESAAGYLCGEDVDEAYIQSARFLHIMGCSLMASPRLAETISRAVDLAIKHEIPISFDPNLRPELIGDGSIREIFEKVLRHAKILLSGEGEIAAATGCEDVNEAIERFSFGRILVLKNGKRPVRVFSGEKRFEIAPYQVDEIDPTGAGDCFDGAFLACLLEGDSLERAALVAAAAGALSVRKKGPMEGACRKQEVFAFLQGRENR